MDDNEREKLIEQMNDYRELGEKYREYANACSVAIPSLQSASGGASFIYDSQTENVCNKLKMGIHPNKGLLDRMCLNRDNLNTDIDKITTIVEEIYLDALRKSSDYQVSADKIMNKLLWE